MTHVNKTLIHITSVLCGDPNQPAALCKLNKNHKVHLFVTRYIVQQNFSHGPTNMVGNSRESISSNAAHMNWDLF